MKYIISTLAIGICCLLVSCNNEQENAITDNTTDLASFEATLAKKYEGKTVYYNNNRPDYSKEIEYLKSVSTEEPMDNIRTKSSDAAALVHGVVTAASLLMLRQLYITEKNGRKSMPLK